MSTESRTNIEAFMFMRGREPEVTPKSRSMKKLCIKRNSHYKLLFVWVILHVGIDSFNPYFSNTATHPSITLMSILSFQSPCNRKWIHVVIWWKSCRNSASSRFNGWMHPPGKLQHSPRYWAHRDCGRKIWRVSTQARGTAPPSFMEWVKYQVSVLNFFFCL